MKKATLYTNVFIRENTTEVSLEDILKNPESIFKSLGIPHPLSRAEEIKSIKDKDLRNHEKRNFYPAVDLSPCNILTIDIDDIFDDPDLKEEVCEKLINNKSCRAVMETASGNLVAMFEYMCDPKDYTHLYYKVYLELTLSLGVNIDFLPDVGRLRYVSLGELYHFNPESDVLREIIKVKKVPFIKTTRTGITNQTVFKSE
jgi:hypothetical protein